ncbi:hypothetical protein HK104_001455 [Borealophlyctis nickersoniae]|nr:hypothetical protein HK104_001455 [Borealophlyctis nickersoniae]
MQNQKTRYNRHEVNHDPIEDFPDDDIGMTTFAAPTTNSNQQPRRGIPIKVPTNSPRSWAAEGRAPATSFPRRGGAPKSPFDEAAKRDLAKASKHAYGANGSLSSPDKFPTIQKLTQRNAARTKLGQNRPKSNSEDELIIIEDDVPAHEATPSKTDYVTLVPNGAASFAPSVTDERPKTRHGRPERQTDKDEPRWEVRIDKGELQPEVRSTSPPPLKMVNRMRGMDGTPRTRMSISKPAPRTRVSMSTPGSYPKLPVKSAFFGEEPVSGGAPFYLKLAHEYVSLRTTGTSAFTDQEKLQVKNEHIKRFEYGIASSQEEILIHIRRFDPEQDLLFIAKLDSEARHFINETQKRHERILRDMSMEDIGRWYAFIDKATAPLASPKRKRSGSPPRSTGTSSPYFGKDTGVDTRSSKLRKTGESRLPYEELFTYPFDGKSCVTVRQEDMERLNEGEFLNDTIIEFYLKHLYNEQLDEKMREETFIFNSFFYEQLSATPQDKTSKTTDDYGYDRVKKWTSKVDLFSKKYIFVPINEHLHWYLALIYNPGALLDQTQCSSTAAASTPESDEAEATAVNGSEGCEGGDDPMDIEEDTKPMPTVPADSGSPAGSRAGSPDVIFCGSEEIPEVPGDEAWFDPPDFASCTSPTSPTPSLLLRSSARIATKRSLEETSEKPAVIDITDEEGNPAPAAEKPKMTKEMRSQKAQEKALAKVQEGKTRCHIFIFDSLQATHRGAVTRLKSYLVKEAEAKKNVILEKPSIGSTHPRVPAQTNHCDCGVYILHYVEVFLKQPEMYLELVLNKSKDETRWLVDDIPKKREQIRQIAEQVEVKWKEEKQKKEAEKLLKAAKATKVNGSKDGAGRVDHSEPAASAGYV